MCVDDDDDVDACSVDISQGIEKDGRGKNDEEVGAGDQGIMFGYATDETPEAMPLTCILAHKLCQKMSELRRDGTLPWLRPDCKSQVTCEYELVKGACVPTRVHTVVISTQHADTISNEDLRAALRDQVVKVHLAVFVFVMCFFFFFFLLLFFFFLFFFF